MNLVVEDDFIKNIGSYIKDQGEYLSEIIKKYIRIMKNVKDKGLIKGKTADALEEFIIQVESNANSKSATSEILGQQTARYCSTFITEIDKADKGLY